MRNDPGFDPHRRAHARKAGWFARSGLAIVALSAWVLVGAQGVALAGSSVAPTPQPLAPPTPAQLAALGADPSAPAAEPSPLGDLPADQPLIDVTFSNGQAGSVSGSAVSRGTGASLRNQHPRASAAAGLKVMCYVNFNHQRKRAVPRGASSVTYHGGIGCERTMLLFGQAFLLEAASKHWGFGNHYEGFMRSASSGQSNHYVPGGANGAQTLYIRHLTNVYFPNPLATGEIVIEPSQGAHLNKASTCGLGKPVSYGGVTYREGLHCDFYSDRF